MAGSATKSPRRWIWRVLWIAGGLAGLILLALAVAVIMLKGSYGATLVRDFADGRQVAGYGELEVGRVRGDVLDSFRIERIALRDEDGVWLEAEDIAIEWSPLALFDRTLSIKAFSVEILRLHRRPTSADRPARSGDGGFDPAAWRLALDDARIGVLDLAEGVAGPAARVTAEAALVRENQAWRGRFSAERLDAPGDQIAADFTLAGTLQAEFSLAAAPDGPFTALLGVAGTTLEADGALNGDALTGSGQARLDADGRQIVHLETQWADGLIELSGGAEPAEWPGLEAAAKRLSGPVRFEAQAPFGEAGLSAIDFESGVLDLNSGALSVRARPAGGRALDVEARLAAGALALIVNENVQARSLDIDGRLDLSGARSFEGRLSGRELRLPGGIAVGQMDGDLALAGPLDALSLGWDLRTSDFTLGQEQADALLGPAPDLSGEAVWRGEARRLDVSRLRIGAQAGRVEGSGAVDVAERSWNADLTSQALRVAALTDLLDGEGAVSVQAGGDFDGALGAEVSFNGYAPAGALDGQLSGPLSGEAVIALSAAGDLTLDAVNLDSPDLRVQAAGAQTSQGWRVDGDAAWSGGAPVSALRLDGALSARFELETAGERLSVRAEARTPSLDVGPERLTEPSLRVEAAGPIDEIAGTVRLTGDGGRGPVDLAADFARQGQGVRIDALSGEAAGFEIEASGTVEPRSLSVEALLSPVTGFGQFQLTAQLGDGRLTADINAEDLVFEDLSYLYVGRIRLEGPLDDAALNYRLEGAYGSQFEAVGEGRVALTGDAPGLTTSLQGEYGLTRLSTRAPLTVNFAGPPSAQAEFDIDEGRLQLSFTGGSDARFTMALENAPAGLLSLRRAREPVEGRLSGEADFARDEGVWTGQARLNGCDLHPAEAEPERNLDGEVRVDLDVQGLQVSASASGQALTARAALSVDTGPVSGLDALTRPDAGLSGEVRIEGRIGDFAAFHLSPAQRLEGVLDLEAQVSGTVSSPVLEGAGALSDGRLRDGRAGLDLQDLTASLNFDESSARLTALSARDGQGGVLTGQGDLNIADPVTARVDIEFDRFRLVDRNDLEAVATGDVAFAFDDGEGRISGSAIIDRADISPASVGGRPIPEIAVTELNRPSSLDPAPASDEALLLALDYQVRAPRRVFVRGPNYDTEWSFNLAITGTSADPVLNGEAELVRGRADLLGRNFDLERGEVILDGDPEDARISLAAINQRQDFTARVEVDGTVSDPKVTLSSEPSLPQDEVASRILFGETPSNLSALQAAQLASALAGLSGGGSGFDPLGALRQAAGLDLLGVRRNAAGETVVSGGRYLTEDVFLQLEGASAGAAPSTRIDWTLTPRVSVSSSIDGRGRAGLALSWRVEYDSNPFDQINLFRGFRDRSGGQDERSEPEDS